MAEKSTFDDALKFAISREEEAVAFYSKAADLVKNPGSATMCKEFAAEEEKHVSLLQNARAKHSMDSVGKQALPPSMELAQYLVSEDITGTSTPQDVMIIAMKKEDAAVALYSDLVSSGQAGELEAIFQSLCNMEKEHRERLEAEYEKHFMPDN